MNIALAIGAFVWPAALLLTMGALADRSPAIGRMLDRIIGGAK